MAKEQYVTFETARLLRRNGFAWKCRCYYTRDGERFGQVMGKPGPMVDGEYECPTQEVAIRWLREEYSMAVVPIPHRYPGTWQVILVYLERSMEGDDKYDICVLKKEHRSYEDAAEYGIRRVVRDVVAKARRAILKKITEED